MGSQINALNTLKNVNNITGNGFHWGIGFEKINLLKADKLISILPLEITKDPRFLEKLYVSAIINELYKDFKILSYAGFNKDIKLFFDPPLIIEASEIDYVIQAMNQTISKPPLKLIINFVKNYLLRLFDKD